MSPLCVTCVCLVMMRRGMKPEGKLVRMSAAVTCRGELASRGKELSTANLHEKTSLGYQIRSLQGDELSVSRWLGRGGRRMIEGEMEKFKKEHEK